LSGTRTITLPRWGSTSTVRETPSWLQWLVALMRFLAQSSRALLWGALIVAALALLYRGLLSRLVHVHHLAIRDSTTEGDCLELIGAHLPEDRHQYSARLVRVWQRAVYGGTDPDSSIVYDLCDTFARALDATSWVPASTGTAGAASTQVTR
jgi:hypothetical protein